VISVTAKVGQKYALDKIAGNTRTHGTKSWQPGFYKADLGAKTLYLISLIAAIDIQKYKAVHGLVHTLITMT